MARPSLGCPKCGVSLLLPQPTPPKVMCPACKSLIQVKPNPVPPEATVGATPVTIGASAAAASSVQTGPPTAAYVPTSTPRMPGGHEFVREIARGGLGVVYLAKHQFLGGLRAVKRPQCKEGLSRDLLLARFRREMQAAGALPYDHIIRAYDAGADEEGPYLVMEYLDGEPLHCLLARQTPLSVPVACELARQAALGLQAAHERGLIHRDIKPSNLMLARVNSDTARVVIIDWGLAKWTSEPVGPAQPEGLTLMGSAMGTADYIAPEQVSDARAVDGRADIYSLGVTLYHLLAGKPPFHGRTEMDKLVAHKRDPFPSLDRQRPDLPKGLLAVVQKMVEKEPARRYATTAEVAEALRPFSAGAGSRLLLELLVPGSLKPAFPVGDTRNLLDRNTELAPSPSVAAAASRRNWPIFAGIGGLACLLIVLAVVPWPRSSRPESDGKSTSGDQTGAKDLSKVLLVEDFRKGQGLPEGWASEAFRIVPHEGRPCLEVGMPNGHHYVKLPPVNLPGDFIIEGAYMMAGSTWYAASNQKMTLLLDSSKSNLPLSVVLHWTGQVSFGNDTRLALPTFKPNQPCTFLLARKGKTLTVSLRDELVATKNIPQASEYDRLSIGMDAPGPSAFTRLTHLKVVALTP